MGAALNERVWFYYAKEVQVGPMTEAELRSAISEGVLSDVDYVYREGFPDWRPLAEVGELKQAAKSHLVSVQISENANQGRRAPRATINELVVAHNDTSVATGRLKNISISGLYFETEDAVFKLNDEIKLTLKEGKGLGRPMHLRALVVRQVRENGLHVGYGLELRGLDETSRSRIVDYVKRHQAN
ncbi:MAG: PilZ domain-containing protein [Silvanigrellaceae bacterium]